MRQSQLLSDKETYFSCIVRSIVCSAHGACTLRTYIVGLFVQFFRGTGSDQLAGILIVWTQWDDVL